MIHNYSFKSETNINLVLREIINTPGISRSEISLKTDLNKATISGIVKQLIEKSYVIEVGTGEASIVGGRKPILLKINKKSGISLCFDVRFDKISYTLNYLNGDIIEIKSYDKNISSKNIVDEIVNIVSLYKDYIENTTFGLVGIAIAIHGVTSNNKIIFTPYYDLSEINLANKLEERLEIPIYLENEANLAAVAESSLDNIHRNVVSCSIHTGVGAGVIINGKLYQGFEGRSGEIGHTTLYPGGIACPCGNYGCFEQYCSQNAIVNFYRIAEQNSSLNLIDLISRYNTNNFAACKFQVQVSHLVSKNFMIVLSLI